MRKLQTHASGECIVQIKVQENNKNQIHYHIKRIIHHDQVEFI